LCECGIRRGDGGAEHHARGQGQQSFPSVEIDGEQYWDGGLVSNTPLQWVIENDPRRKDTLAFQDAPRACHCLQ
jgi:NTE family protein